MASVPVMDGVVPEVFSEFHGRHFLILHGSHTFGWIGDRGAISLQSVASTVFLESITFLLTILALLRWSILGHRAAASVEIRHGSVEGLAVSHLWLKAVSFWSMCSVLSTFTPCARSEGHAETTGLVGGSPSSPTSLWSCSAWEGCMVAHL